jgi:PAS domain S-box-containing protein
LAVAVSVVSLFIPEFGQGLAGLLLFAVLVATWYGGLGPGLWSTFLEVISCVAIYVWAEIPIVLWRFVSLAVLAGLGALCSLAVSAQRSARRRAEESEKWLSALLTSIGEAVIATDRVGTVVFMNSVAESLTGWGQAEASGRPLVEVCRLCAEEDRTPVSDPVKSVLEGGSRPGRGSRELLIARDGSEHPVAQSAAPIKGPADEVSGVVYALRDISPIKRAEDELREADRRKDEFLAMLAHELRNPLAAVNNAVAVLRIASEGEKVAIARDFIARQVRHLTRLIDDLLDVSRITRGKIHLRREFIDAETILDHAVETVRPLLDERGHELSVSIERGKLPIWVDSARIEQAVVNLLTNAAKYTEPGGRIWLSALPVDGQVAITVGDNGMGIVPEKIAEIFELFAQGDRAIDRSEGGLGIGLTIVQALAQMHGGSVTASSRGPGEGSEFTLRLPAMRGPRVKAETPVPDDPETDPPNPTAFASSPGTCARILIVDDNVDMAWSLSKLLELNGNEAVIVHDGPSAIEMAHRIRPDVILLDIGLPGMDGYQVAGALRRDDDLKEAIIIGLSGYGQEEDCQRSLAAGFDHHLVKPIEFDRLAALLAAPVASVLSHDERDGLAARGAGEMLETSIHREG